MNVAGVIADCVRRQYTYSLERAYGKAGNGKHGNWKWKLETGNGNWKLKMESGKWKLEIQSYTVNTQN